MLAFIFALAAAFVALLAIFDVTHAELMWWWLLFVALYLAFVAWQPSGGPTWMRGNQRQ